MNDKSGRVVFVGNIPYDIPEEMITETLSRVGQVLSFRLVIDKEMNKPKGYGFAEFADADAAASAIRNLNDFELMGRRLRVDYPNDGAGSGSYNNNNDGGGAGGVPGSQGGVGPGANLDGSAVPGHSSTVLPPFPPGVTVPPDTTSIDVISQTLKQIKLPQLLDIIKDVKALVHKDPVKATELFRQAPQLSYAVFQCLLLMGLVDAQDLSAILANQPIAGGGAVAGAAKAGTPGPPSGAPTGPAAAAVAAAMGMPGFGALGAGRGSAPPPPSHQPTPPAAGYAMPGAGAASAVVPPPPPPPPPAAAPQTAAQAQQPHGVLSQQQLIEQVLALTPQQIEMLPEPDRRQIEELRRQIAAGAFR